MKSLFANNVLEVLAILFLNREEAIHQSKIVTLSGLRVIQVQRALQRLSEAGLIEEYQQGNMVYYKLEKNQPILTDLKNILYKTILISEPFKKAFEKFTKQISIAFIYGSFAKGTETAESDIDLFVVGEVGLKQLSKLLSPIAKQLQREINPVIYPKAEFIIKVRKKDHFVTSVMHSRKLWLVGDDNELKKMVK